VGQGTNPLALVLTFVSGGTSYALIRQISDDGWTSVYECRRHGFRLVYPSTWTVAEELDQVAFTPPGAEELSFVVYAPLLASQAGPDDRYLFEAPLDQVAEMMVAGLQQELPSFRTLERAAVLHLFAPATMIRFSAVDPDTRQEMVATVVILRTQRALYSLAYGAPPASYARYQPEFEQVLRSFGVAHGSHDPRPVPTEAVRLVRSQVIDPMLGLASHTFLVPEGWQQQGAAQWRDHPFPFAAIDFALFDPRSGAAVRFLSYPHFTWMEPNITGVAPGGLAHNRRVAMPPLKGDPNASLQHVVLPQHFGHASQLSIVEIVPMPGVAAETVRQAIAGGTHVATPSEAESYRARLHYQRDGVALEEDVYFTLLFASIADPYAPFYTPNPFSPGATSEWAWYPTELYSLRANRGELDAMAPLLRAVVASSRQNLEWFAVVLAMHRQHDQAISEMGVDLMGALNRVKHERNELANMLFGEWQATQQRQDRIHDAYSQYIRGTQSYRSPAGERVELPAHYPSVWQQQGGGAYILSMDPGFDPHAGAGGSWRRMR
jgi:hypothetical protein